MPDLIVRVEEPGHLAALNQFDTRDAVFRINSPLRRVIDDSVNPRTILTQPAEVFVQPRWMLDARLAD